MPLHTGNLYRHKGVYCLETGSERLFTGDGGLFTGVSSRLAGAYDENMTTSRNRAVVVLSLSASVPTVIIEAKVVTTAMDGNANFPSPNPTIATVIATTQKLYAAETAAADRQVGATGDRDVVLAQLLAQLHQLKAYVQQVADADSENARSIIESAGMKVKKPTSYSKLPFVVKHGAVSGVVEASVKAIGRRAAYWWQWSLDQQTWTDGGQTLQSKTTFTNLQPGKTYYFRYATLTKDGKGDWSVPVSLIVI
jgi:hypothetical protein